MNPILFMKVDVITDQTAQVPLIQRDDVIEHLAAATSDPVRQKYSICLSTWDFGLLAAWRAFLGYIPDTSA